MLVFIDESGDSGFKFKNGSSEIFTMILAIFDDNNSAMACDKAIENLKKEVFGNTNEEFHFKNNSDKQRKLFLQEVAKHKFCYYGFVLNKKLLYGKLFKNKEDLYKIICFYICGNARDKLDDAKVIIDKNGSFEFKNNLKKYLKLQLNDDDKIRIREVKMQDSKKNNLIQLADYIASSLNRAYTKKSRKEYNYIDMLSSKKKYVQYWPI